MAIPGIDVSLYQASVDWEAVAKSGKKFAFLRATTGNDFTDPTFAHNRQAAKAAGLKVGAYHYAYPGKGDAVTEAKHFLSVAKPVAGELLPVLDFEDTLNVAWAATFVQTIKDAIGVYPLLYSMSSWFPTLGKSDVLRRCPIWVADYGPNDGKEHPLPTLYRKPSIHQYTSKGTVPGIHGNVDMNDCLVALSDVAYVKPRVLVGFTVSFVDKTGKRVEKQIKHPVWWANTHKKAYRRGRVVISRRFA